MPSNYMIINIYYINNKTFIFLRGKVAPGWGIFKLGCSISMRDLVSYIQSRKESDITEHAHTHAHIHTCRK